jgi:hypothetical protein
MKAMLRVRFHKVADVLRVILDHEIQLIVLVDFPLTTYT